jgi:hypothetical protein
MLPQFEGLRANLLRTALGAVTVCLGSSLRANPQTGTGMIERVVTPDGHTLHSPLGRGRLTADSREAAGRFRKGRSKFEVPFG